MVKLEELFNRFTSRIRIKKGGQKTVYKVCNDDIFFALKLIYCANDPRVMQEITIAKEKGIPNIPVIFETGIVWDSEEQEEVLYIIEEYINGVSMRDWLKAGNKSNLRQAYEILEQLLLTEVELEKVQILHRDINPNNIIMNDNKVRLIDFGLAKIIGIGGASLTQTAATHGPFTPGYAPHEQVANMKLKQNVRTDLFQIGVTIYECITGRNPFIDGAKDLSDILDNTINLYPPILNIDGDTQGMFYQLINMMMAKEQSQRPESASRTLDYLYAIKDSLVWEA